MGSKKPVDMSSEKELDTKKTKKVSKKVAKTAVAEKKVKEKTEEKKEATSAKEESKEELVEKKESQEAKKPVVAKVKKHRSKKYQAVRSKVDRTRTYDSTSAIEMVKKLSYSKFAGTISAHLTVREVGISKEVALPHSTGQSRVVVIASDEVLAKIEAGDISFDVLISTPQFMAKLTKFAPVLGPKGLMPNPKNGTLTTNPEQRKKELEAGSVVLKTERKAPLIHASVGKTDMETSQLVENLEALFKAFKGRLLKATIAASMSPGVKVSWEE